MNHERTITKGSKRLSWLLRHGAGEAGLKMDEAGWVSCREVQLAAHLSRAAIKEVVRCNNKSRLQLEDDRIRACQGHSLDGMPVTQDALEASWTRYKGGPSIWHGTNVVAAEFIAEEGIMPGNRTHVHLASATDSKVGKRHSTPVLLEVSVEALRSAGREVFVSPNGVVLVRDVPPKCVVDLKAISRKAKLVEPKLRGLFNLADKADKEGGV